MLVHTANQEKIKHFRTCSVINLDSILIPRWRDEFGIFPWEKLKILNNQLEQSSSRDETIDLFKMLVLGTENASVF